MGAEVTARLAIVAVIAAALAGCAQDPPAQPVAPVVRIETTRSDFCEIMRSLHGQSGKLSWSVRDTPETITGVRRLAAAFDKRCATKAVS